MASLMKADAPALVASFQCDVSLQSEDDGTQNMRASLRELKVLARPFIPDQQEDSVTTVSAREREHVPVLVTVTSLLPPPRQVLRPCSVTMETRTHPQQPLSGSVTMEEIIVKVRLAKSTSRRCWTA